MGIGLVLSVDLSLDVGAALKHDAAGLSPAETSVRVEHLPGSETRGCSVGAAVVLGMFLLHESVEDVSATMYYTSLHELTLFFRCIGLGCCVRVRWGELSA